MPRPTASMSKSPRSCSTTATIASSAAWASLAGVSTRARARIWPDSSTTPPATLVPPMSTPMVCPIDPPSVRLTASPGRCARRCRAAPRRASGRRSSPAKRRAQRRRRVGKVTVDLRAGAPDQPEQLADRAHLALRRRLAARLTVRRGGVRCCAGHGPQPVLHRRGEPGGLLAQRARSRAVLAALTATSTGPGRARSAPAAARRAVPRRPPSTGAGRWAGRGPGGASPP